MGWLKCMLVYLLVEHPYANISGNPFSSCLTQCLLSCSTPQMPHNWGGLKKFASQPEIQLSKCLPFSCSQVLVRPCCSPLICIWRLRFTKWLLFFPFSRLSAPLLVTLWNYKVHLWTVSAIPAANDTWLCPKQQMRALPNSRERRRQGSS